MRKDIAAVTVDSSLVNRIVGISLTTFYSRTKEKLSAQQLGAMIKDAKFIVINFSNELNAGGVLLAPYQHHYEREVKSETQRKES